MHLLRFITRMLLVGLGLIALLPLHGAWRLVRARSPWPQLFLRWAAYASGIRVRVEGVPLARDVLFAANHRSWLDILLLGGSAGAAFVSKEEVAHWPVVGWLAKVNRTVFVARAERGAVREQADALRNALSSGQPVALFAEGTVSESEEMLPFRPSLFASLYPPLAAARVQPVAIDYGAAARDIAWIDDETIVANARRVLGRAGRMPVVLRFLPPIDPGGAGDRKALAAAAQAAVAAALGASGAAPAPLYPPR